MNRKYFSTTGSRLSGLPLMDKSQPLLATSGSTLIPTVSPAAVGMIAISSRSVSATSPAGCASRSSEQSLFSTGWVGSNDQQIASRWAESVPEKTVAPGDGFSQAVSASKPRTATKVVRSGLRGGNLDTAPFRAATGQIEGSAIDDRCTRLPLLTVTHLSGKRPVLDPGCVDAVDLAREAASEVAPEGTVGDHLGVEPEEERMVLHSFEATLPGYRGWRWAVTVMRASRSKRVSVGEVVLLPGTDSLLSPTWVPWTERLRPGDLGVGDLLPTDEDDPRLEPGWNALEDIEAEVSESEPGDEEEGVEDGWVDADAILAVSLELDLMRPRVLSPIGLDDAIDRWEAGEHGPDAPIAQTAPARCATCGFRVSVRGTLGHAFGVCANEISPSDGHVVSLGHGCGAHSEAVVVPALAERPEPVIDEVGFETVEHVVLADEPIEPEPFVDEARAADVTAEPAVELGTD